MIPEDPSAKGWHKSHKGTKFHSFTGKYQWNLSKCGRLHVPIQRLLLVSEDSIAKEQKCKKCLRILEMAL